MFVACSDSLRIPSQKYRAMITSHNSHQVLTLLSFRLFAGFLLLRSLLHSDRQCDCHRCAPTASCRMLCATVSVIIGKPPTGRTGCWLATSRVKSTSALCSSKRAPRASSRPPSTTMRCPPSRNSSRPPRSVPSRDPSPHPLATRHRARSKSSPRVSSARTSRNPPPSPRVPPKLCTHVRNVAVNIHVHVCCMCVCVCWC
jgi:hypothetical protein